MLWTNLNLQHKSEYLLPTRCSLHSFCRYRQNGISSSKFQVQRPVERPCLQQIQVLQWPSLRSSMGSRANGRKSVLHWVTGIFLPSSTTSSFWLLASNCRCRCIIYSWWKKSCTTQGLYYYWDKPTFTYPPSGAGFVPSTVCWRANTTGNLFWLWGL